ncbi:MAG TPA: hypothetical protein VEK11_11250 [Thermoanaerobaculia bacterium]|nr:hypothetical protein [Thermoanaerobaculia bacterium]
MQPEEGRRFERGLPPDVVIFHYRVYGLALQSSMAIAGLEPVSSGAWGSGPESQAFDAGSADPDCTLVLGDVEPLPETVDEDVTRDGDTFVFVYRDGTRFRIEERGRRIVTAWESTPEDMATYLLGPILAFVLRLRGTLALHASAVRVGDGALLFAGAAGAGKSTTAAAFVARGSAMLADDVAAIDWREGVPFVRTGYPRLRLWDDSAAALYGAADALPLLTPTWAKRFADARASFAGEAARVRAITILGPRDASTHTRPLHGAEAVMAVLARTSVPHLLDATARAEELAEIARLVDTVPVYEVRAREDLAALHEVVDIIEAVLV